MVQKVAAMIENVAADLAKKPSEVRWLLQRKKFYYCRYLCRLFMYWG
jgi:hypothetical protein